MTPRKQAEKAALAALQDSYVGLIGDLGEARAAMDTAPDAVARARSAGVDHVATEKAKGDQRIADAKTAAAANLEHARARSRELVTSARTQVAAVTDRYRDAFDAAVSAGWKRAQLVDLGYAKPTPRRSAASPARGSTTG